MLFQAVQKFLKQKRESKHKNSESGATLTEYSLVVSLVVMVAMYPMWKMGDETARVLCDAGDTVYTTGAGAFLNNKSNGFGTVRTCEVISRVPPGIPSGASGRGGR